MGRNRGNNKGNKRLWRRDFKESRSDEWRDKRPRTDGWEAAVTDNELFTEYYQGQKICPPEEWDAFLDALRRPLPTTFRINGTGKFATQLRDRLQTDFLSRFSDAPLEIDGEAVAPPAPLPWYPDNLGWSFSFSKAQLRKLPALEALHSFMKRETAVGGISRQEAVSMVPPLFLDVHPGHRVLDMCAAPGSKTAQILEALHSSGGGPDVGCVVANDADAKRCNLLTHQTLRICSPALVVTNHEAQLFPLLRDLTGEEEARISSAGGAEVPAAEGAAQQQQSVSQQHIQFDRVLADVPCSGDGTIRKAPDIWRKWTAGNGNGLHTLQLRIALRGAELVAVGGRMVYSTCTFNPIEDEAVVAELLRRTGGALELVDVSAELPELRRVPGMSSWRVRDREGWHDAWEGDGEHGFKLAPTMFPGSDTADLHLERCMRFLPHHQDTGGFFVAVLQKIHPIEGKIEVPMAPGLLQRQRAKNKSDDAVVGTGETKTGGAPEGAAETTAEVATEEQKAVVEEATEAADEPAAVEESADAAEESDPTPESAAAVDAPAEAEATTVMLAPKREPKPVEVPVWGATRGGGGRGREGGRWGGIDPIVPFTDAEYLSSMRSFYGMPEDCPVLDALISRSTDPKPKRLSYVSSAVKHLLLNDVREALKVTAAGVKVFERQESKDGLVGCIYRLAQEGMPMLLPYLTKQTLALPLEELTALLTQRLLPLPAEAHVHITRQPVTADAGAAEGAAARTAEGAEENAAAKEVKVETKEEQTITPGPEADTVPEPAAAKDAEQSGDEQAQKPTGNRPRKLADAESLAQIAEVKYGGCIAMLRGVEGAGAASEAVEAAAGPIAVSCWRGRAMLTVLASKDECHTIQDLLAEKAAADETAVKMDAA